MSSQLSYRLHGREQRPKTLRKHYRDGLDTGQVKASAKEPRSPNTPAKRSTTTSAPPAENRATPCSAAAVDEARALQHGNTPVWLPDGSRALASIPAGSARIHCAEPR